jgi:hypothetical protein
VGPPCLAPASSSFEYAVNVSEAGTYWLTANHTTWHPNQVSQKFQKFLRFSVQKFAFLCKETPFFFCFVNS